MRYGICPGGRYGNWIEGGNGYFWEMMIGTIVLVAVLTVIFVVIYKKKKKNKEVSDSKAEEILKMRFVNGEITEEEYIQKKNILK
jgi:putative membrane protein